MSSRAPASERRLFSRTAPHDRRLMAAHAHKVPDAVNVPPHELRMAAEPVPHFLPERRADVGLQHFGTRRRRPAIAKQCNGKSSS